MDGNRPASVNAQGQTQSIPRTTFAAVEKNLSEEIDWAGLATLTTAQLKSQRLLHQKALKLLNELFLPSDLEGHRKANLEKMNTLFSSIKKRTYAARSALGNNVEGWDANLPSRAELLVLRHTAGAAQLGQYLDGTLALLASCQSAHLLDIVPPDDGWLDDAKREEFDQQRVKNERSHRDITEVYNLQRKNANSAEQKYQKVYEGLAKKQQRNIQHVKMLKKINNTISTVHKSLDKVQRSLVKAEQVRVSCRGVFI